MTEEHDEEAGLLVAWRDGDRAAGVELVRRFHPILRRFFANKVSRPDDADDLVQKTLLACTARKDRIAGSCRGYLYGVARNVLKRYIDEKSRIKREETDFETVCVRDYTDPSLSSIIARKREVELLIAALRELPLGQQIVFELHKIEELSGREIAELLALPEGTVRSRLRLAEERLRIKIAELAGSSAERNATLASLHSWTLEIRALIDQQKPRS